MATGPSGNSRRRIAGGAARRRREAESSTDAVDEATTSAGVEESTAEVESKGAEESKTADKPKKKPPGTPRTRRVLSAPPRESWWWLGALAVVAVATVIFVAIVGFRYLADRSDDEAFADGRVAATSAAATSAETILTYSYESLEDDRVAAEKTMTADFAKEYGELYTKPYCEAFPVNGECTVEGTFPQVVERNQQQTESTVVDVAPMECGDECSDTKASVLLFIDQHSTANGEQQNPVGNRAVFSMVKQNGDWLVDGIRYV